MVVEPIGSASTATPSTVPSHIVWGSLTDDDDFSPEASLDSSDEETVERPVTKDSFPRNTEASRSAAGIGGRKGLEKGRTPRRLPNPRVRARIELPDVLFLNDSTEDEDSTQEHTPTASSPDEWVEKIQQPLHHSQEEDHLRQLQQQLQPQPERLPQRGFAEVPLGPTGETTSVGSIEHSAGNCNPCVFMNSPFGCLTGINCGYCHMPHAKASVKNRSRPCKGKRLRYLKVLGRLFDKVQTDPYNFRVDDLALPPSIAASDIMKVKLFTVLRTYMQQVKEQNNMASSRTGQPSLMQRPSLDINTGGTHVAGSGTDTGQFEYRAGQFRYPVLAV